MKRIHLIGIGGTGLSAIARILLESGYAVSGSDAADSSVLQELRALGAAIYIGHAADKLGEADLVVRSSAIPDDNVEVAEARKRGIPVQKRAEFLGSLMEGKTGIAVAGTHGKTTTTSMLAWMLSALGEDPSFISGGVVRNLGVNAHAGKGSAFVIEADEYDRMFLGLKPAIAVITSAEHDHPDCYPTPQNYESAFVEFARKLPEDGTLIYCAEDAGADRVADAIRKDGRQVRAYGFNLPGTTLFATASTLEANSMGGFSFDADVDGRSGRVELQAPGRHNVLNALAALAVCALLGLNLAAAGQALSAYQGSGRRFEVAGEAKGITLVNDYAHHPTEIRATLAAARLRYPGSRIIAVWQPHTYSRTQTLFQQFTACFADADEVIITEIYRSREPVQKYSARMVVQAMDHPAAHFMPELQEVSNYLVSHSSPGDVVLVLSAGDADTVAGNVLSRLKEA